MATLHGQNGTFLELSIEGYQFPAIADDKWDSNWLMVAVHANDGTQTWRARAAAVLVSEFRSLSNGLVALAAGDVFETEWDAIEPCLEVAGRCDGDKCRLDFSLAYELSPDRVAGSSAALSFDLSREALTQFALDLGSSGKKYPGRGPGSKPTT